MTNVVARSTFSVRYLGKAGHHSNFGFTPLALSVSGGVEGTRGRGEEGVGGEAFPPFAYGLTGISRPEGGGRAREGMRCLYGCCRRDAGRPRRWEREGEENQVELDAYMFIVG